MFIGSYDHNLDTKSRMIIPAKYREELGFKCVVTKGIDTCLYVYPLEAWESFAEKLSQLPKTDSKARSFVRHFYGNAEECEIDKQGRITIPPMLKRYGQIEKEIVSIGNGEKIEVWSKKQYQEELDQSGDDGEQLAQGMQEYGI